jgi:2-oxoisovalerate dehydrogenase E1 component alpha subunit
LGDPVARLKAHLIRIGEWDEERHEALLIDLTNSVKKTQKDAENNGILGHGLHQPLQTMFDDVFEETPWHLKEQCEDMLAEQRRKFGPDWEAS